MSEIPEDLRDWMLEKIIAHPKMLNIPEKHSYFTLYSDKQKREHPSDPKEWSYWKKVLQFPVNLTVGEMTALIIERIAAAEAQVALLQAQIDALRSENQRLQWQPITPENLPNVGDELYNARIGNLMQMPKGYAPMIPLVEDFTFAGWTHFRPINAPARAEAPQEKPPEPFAS